MSLVVPAFATRQFTLTAGQAIAVWGQGAFKVTQLGPYVNAPPAPTVLVDRPAGSLVYQSSTFTNGAVIDVDAYGGLDVFVEQGTDAQVKQGRTQNGIQPASQALNTTGAITASMILGGRVTSTTAANVDGTVPTGAVLAAASSWAVGEYVDWVMYNSGTNVFALVAASNHTLIGGAGAAIACPTLTSVTVRTTQVSAGVFTSEAIARAVS